MTPKQPGRRCRLTAMTLLACALAGRASVVHAQTKVGLGGAVEVGGEEERYLRALQVAGVAPLTPWTIQPFSVAQTTLLRTLAPHPWADRYGRPSSSGASLLRGSLRAIENTSFPYQIGGGPTWAGRGLTLEAQAGFAATWRAVHLQLAPLAFIAQNASFDLAPNGQTGDLRFADARFPLQIDAPQRFGDKAYGKVTPGTSSLMVEGFGLFGGVTTAPQRWGPAREYPLVLGPNAGGFPSVTIGLAEPVNLWLFRTTARLIYGQLRQSDYTATVAGERRRLASGLVFTIVPRGVPGLEIGAARFIQGTWPDSGIRLATLERPFSGGFNVASVAENVALENQMASVFARWTFPRAKAEFYGEMYREDFPGRFHEALSLVEKPDDLASIMLGFQRVMHATAQSVFAIRAELVNGETSHQERDVRGFYYPYPPYIHTLLTQGHTLNGLMLGSPDANGGSGWRFGFDDYSPRGRSSVTFERSLRLDWLPTDTVPASNVHPDVMYSVRAEALRFMGSREITVALIPTIDLNRNLVARHDAFNFAAAVTVRGW